MHQIFWSLARRWALGKCHIHFWENLNMGSIWSPFSRIWLFGARIRCHGSVSQKSGSHFPVIDSTLRQEGCTFQVWVKTDSDLIQNWFRSDSKLVQIWFKIGSNLIQNWIWLPSHPSCEVCREEEALTFPDWFITEFCCPLMSWADMRRLWHFQIYSSLNPLLSLKLPVANIMGGKHFLRIWFISEFSSISVIRSKYLCLIFESHWNLNLLTQSNSLILLCFFIFDSFPHWFKSDFCLGEEALTCPNWFKPYFRYCLTLHIMKFEVRKLWHFQTDSRLISVEARKLWYIQTDSSLISVNVWSSITWSFRWESSDISRLIQVLFPLLSSPL